VKVFLVGIRVFENLGSDYTKAFARVFPELAKEKGVKLLPFLLEGVALQKDLNQSDGKHPNAKGHDVIAKNVAQELEKML
jgi:acyl-CoA thioesterase-1